MSDLEAQLAELKSTTQSITVEEVLKLDQLADLINTEVSEVTLMSTSAADSKEPEYDWQLIDLLLDAQKTIYGCFDKVAAQDENAQRAVRKLRQRMYIATTTVKKSIQTIQARQGTEGAPADTGGNEAVEKLKKRLQQIETDIADKDQQLLDQETQLLQLTDTVQSSQKKEDELRKKLSAFDELEMQHEAKVNDMYQ